MPLQSLLCGLRYPFVCDPSHTKRLAACCPLSCIARTTRQQHFACAQPSCRTAHQTTRSSMAYPKPPSRHRQHLEQHQEQPPHHHKVQQQQQRYHHDDDGGGAGSGDPAAAAAFAQQQQAQVVPEAPPSSRLCIKNIPKYVQEQRLKDHFAGRGQVTDVKILKTRSVGAEGRKCLVSLRGQAMAVCLAASSKKSSDCMGSACWCMPAERVGMRCVTCVNTLPTLPTPHHPTPPTGTASLARWPLWATALLRTQQQPCATSTTHSLTPAASA